MPRYRSDETDGPAGQRDSLRRYYAGQPPAANKRQGSPWDTTGRDDARRKSDALRADETEDDSEEESEDEGVITDEELAAAMRTASRSAARRAGEDEDEQEDEEETEGRGRTDEDEDDDDAPSSPALRVECPGCRSKFRVAPPPGMRVAEDEGEDEEESEGGVRTGNATCPDCRSKFRVAAPEGYKFVNDEDEEEDEDEQEDAKDIADTAHLTERGRRRAAEALVTQFFRRYRGKLLREQQRGRLARRRGRSTGSPALDAFIESYRDEMKFRRNSAMPPE